MCKTIHETQSEKEYLVKISTGKETYYLSNNTIIDHILDDILWYRLEHAIDENWNKTRDRENKLLYIAKGLYDGKITEIIFEE